MNEKELLEGYVEFDPITKLLYDLKKVPNFKAFDIARKLPSKKQLEELRKK